MLLALACMLAIVSCGNIESIIGIIEESRPTVVTTHVAYSGKDKLEGEFITKTDGASSVFEYSYMKYATVAEMSDSRIKTIEGKIYENEDGEITVEGAEWVAADTNSIVKFNLRIEESKFKTYDISRDGKKLNGTITSENSERVLGSAIKADGDITIEIVTDGVEYLYYINVSYKSESGADVSIRTSYDYSPVEIIIPIQAG